MSESGAKDQERAVEIPPWVASTVSCDDAVHQLYDFLDGELTEERRQQIAAHLDGCAPCIGAATFEAELRQVIADRCREAVPDALRARVAAALDRAGDDQS
ncbi:MAG: mycothiol system anti-sigma-R factor [Actinomycetes bacterium]